MNLESPAAQRCHKRRVDLDVSGTSRRFAAISSALTGAANRCGTARPTDGCRRRLEPDRVHTDTGLMSPGYIRRALRLVVAVSASAGCAAALSPGQASAHGPCGRDWTPGSACAVNGSNVALNGTIVASDETDYYVFHARADTEIKLAVAAIEPKACVATASCAEVDATLSDNAGANDYDFAGTAGIDSNTLSASAPPYIIELPGTYLISVHADDPGTAYRVKVVTSPGAVWPYPPRDTRPAPSSRGTAPPPSALPTRSVHHANGSSWAGGVVVFMVFVVVIRWTRRRWRRHRGAEKRPSGDERASHYERWQAQHPHDASDSGDHEAPPVSSGPDQNASGSDGEPGRDSFETNGNQRARTGYRPDWAFEKLELNVTATLAEAKLQRKHLAARYHPDKSGTATPEIRRLAEEEMKNINEAYEAIADWIRTRAAPRV